jgi:hypothetical protein
VIGGCQPLGPRTFVVEVDKLVDPPETLTLTVRDHAGVVAAVEPHPAAEADWDPFRGGLPFPDTVAVNVDGDTTSLLVLWLSDAFCDESVALDLVSIEGRPHLAVTVSSRRNANAPEPCGGTLTPLGVNMRLSRPVPADHAVLSFDRVP